MSELVKEMVTETIGERVAECRFRLKSIEADLKRIDREASTPGLVHTGKLRQLCDVLAIGGEIGGEVVGGQSP